MREEKGLEKPWQPMKDDFVRFDGEPHQVLTYANLDPLRVISDTLPIRGRMCRVRDIRATSGGIMIKILPLTVERSRHIAGEVIRGKIRERDPVASQVMSDIWLPISLFKKEELKTSEYDDTSPTFSSHSGAASRA